MMNPDERTEARSDARSARFDVRGLMTEFASSTWAVMEYGWYPLLLFIATPWFLHKLGTEQYGQWMLLNAAAALSSLLSIGTSAATIKAVSTGIGRSANADVERTVNASLAIAVVGGSVLALSVGSFFWFGSDTLL